MGYWISSIDVVSSALVGQYTDPESGLLYLRARYYDPSTGQFLTRDPLVAETLSAYGYVADNPLNGTDPLGLWGWNPLKDVGQAWHDTLGQHWRGATQVAITVAGVALIASCTVATEGLCAVALTVGESEISVGAFAASAAIGAAERVADYAVSGGCHDNPNEWLKEAAIGAGVGTGESILEEFTPLANEAGAHAAPAGLLKTLLGFW